MNTEEQDFGFLPYTVCTRVVHGKRLGHKLGFPTANQNIDAPDRIRRGIYASTAEIGEECYYAVSNVGTRPTVGGTGVNCESYMIGFSGDLYGKTVKITLHAFLRDERKFDSVDELREQISQDVEAAKEYFASETK